MRICNLLLTIFVAALSLTSCGDSKHFRVEATFDGLGAESVEMIYAGDEGVQRIAGRADAEGRVSLQGSSAEPVIVWLMRSNGDPICFLLARNGEKISVAMKPGDYSTFTIEGSDDNEALGKFFADNAGIMDNPARRRDLDAAIARYVGANPSSIASTALLVTLYDAENDPAAADKLFGSLSLEARKASLTADFRSLLANAVVTNDEMLLHPFSIYDKNDSLISFLPTSKPYSLLAFTSLDKPDSVTAMLRRVRGRHDKARLEMMEIGLWGDPDTWRADVRGDSATWRQGYAAGGPSSTALRRYKVPRTPFFIITDSTGRATLRTSGVAAVEKYLQSHAR